MNEESLVGFKYFSVKGLQNSDYAYTRRSTKPDLIIENAAKACLIRLGNYSRRQSSEVFIDGQKVRVTVELIGFRQGHNATCGDDFSSTN